MTWEVAQRIEALHTGIFNELREWKQQKESEGVHVIDLSIGSPDQAPPSFIVQALMRGIQDTSQYGYSMGAVPEFSEAIRAYYAQRFHVQLDANKQTLLLMGSQDGLVHLPLAFVNPGDVVIVPDPGYPAYQTGSRLAGASIYSMPLREQNQFLPDLSAIPPNIAHKAKLMVLNIPGNPVPTLASRDYLAQVVQFAKQHQIIIVHDFAYADLVFDGKKPVSILEVPGAMDVAVEFHSLSKSFNMAGARIGYMVGNETVIQTLARVKSNLDYGVFTPIQQAAAVALRDGASFLAEHARVYEKRRNVLVDGLNQIGWPVSRPPATMFVWAKVPRSWTSRQFAKRLVQEAAVLVTPGNAFGEYGEGYVRIALVQESLMLQEAIKRMQQSTLFSTSK